VLTDHAELIQLLLDHRANPDLKDHEGRTAADLARQRGKRAAAELLARQAAH
jgi:ankyrin repeat protein